MEQCQPAVKRKKPKRLNENSHNVNSKKPAAIPVIPPRPSDVTNDNLFQRGNKGSSTKSPVVPPRPTEKQLNDTITRSSLEKAQTEDTMDYTDNSESLKDGVDTNFKQNKVEALVGMFENGPTERVPTFTSYISEPKEKDKPEDAPANETPETKQSSQSELGRLSENNNNKEKEGIFSGIFQKSLKPTEDTEDKQSLQTELSDSNENLSDNRNTKEKGGLFSGLFRKIPKAAGDRASVQDKESLDSELSASTDSLSENSNTKKGGVFSGMFRKSPNPAEDVQTEETAQKELSASSDSLTENPSTKGKGAMFDGMFRKSPKKSESPEPEEDTKLVHSDVSDTYDIMSGTSNNKEKGGLISGLFRKTPKAARDGPPVEDKEQLQSELSTSNDSLSEKREKKEKRGVFSGLLMKSTKPQPEEENQSLHNEMSASSDSLSENNTKQKGGIFSGMFRKLPKPAEDTQSEEQDKQSLHSELSASNDSLSETSYTNEKGGLFSGLLKQAKVTADGTPTQDIMSANRKLSASNDCLFDNSNTQDKQLIFGGLFKKAKKPAEDFTSEEGLNLGMDRNLSASYDNLLENTATKKPGGLTKMFKWSPKPVQRSTAAEDPLSGNMEHSASSDSLSENTSVKDSLSGHDEHSASNDNLYNTTTTKEKKLLGGIFRRNPKPVEQQVSMDTEPLEGGRQLRGKRTIQKKRQVSFRVRRTLPRVPKFTVAAQSSDCEPIIDETVEMQELSSQQEIKVEIQPAEMLAYPTEGNPLESEEENDGLMDWWRTVAGWDSWNETSDFKEDQEEQAVEQVADRVFMAARLFVRLFNRRGASLQKRVLELLAQADAADQFHKKAVQAAVGGGVASVAGSVATITGLILAPFTFGASIIVTAVGISVATAGSITSATANITDTVHSNNDRKKVEKMILDYQEEIKDIRECLEFVQEGMDTLQEWDFEKYSDSVAKKALNQNVKHVMKEGGRAGKQLMINTDKLISTVQVLGVAGGAAKAAQAISVTTGVMSALFLALDVFFLAKDSHELRKGAKTKFANKIREVCKDLQGGLLELNKVKTQLQKTMDGIELEEYEEEVEVEIEEDLESDPVNLAQLDQELDMLEEKLDKKVQEAQMGNNGQSKKKNKDEKNEGKESKGEKKEEEELGNKNKTIELERSCEIEKENNEKEDSGGRSVGEKKSCSTEDRKEGSERRLNSESGVEKRNIKMESKSEKCIVSPMLDKNKDKNGNELERNQIDPKIEIWDKKGHVERSCNEGEMEKRESRDYSKKQEVERSKRSRHEGRSEKVQGMNDKDKDRHNRVTTSHCKGDSSDTKKGSKKDRRVRDSISEWERTTEEKCSKESKREAEKFSYKEESVGNKKSVYKSWAVEGTQKEEDTTRICFEREMESKTERGKGRQKSTIESTRRFESGGESGVRNKEGEIWQRERDSRAKEKKNKEINPPHRGSRPRSKAVLNDGLDI